MQPAFHSVNTILQSYIQQASTEPGIYRFYNHKHELLYVGKARNLRKRLSNYLRNQSSLRISSLVNQIASIEITITSTENEALLLERNLIKTLKPYYNILLRDDKSYPYLVLSEHSAYPRLNYYRGKPKGKAEYFGPYPSVVAVKETLNILQKLFRIRPCRDSFFKNRTRPCLQHQIKRCDAPCVAYISPEDYQENLQWVRLFLKGKSLKIIEDLTKRMEVASQHYEYEQAVQIRNQILYLREIQQQQSIITSTQANTDVIALIEKQGLYCIYILPIRNGEVSSGQSYFPKVPPFSEKKEILSSFISQFYFNTLPIMPTVIIVDTRFEDQDWLGKTLSKHHQSTIKIRKAFSSTQVDWISLAQKNAEQSLTKALQMQDNQHKQREALQAILNLPTPVERMECFDVSHTQGEATVASCVVFNAEGPFKKEYRRFTITDLTPGDDYAAMYKALMRHYKKKLYRSEVFPDVLIVDGGKGQLTQAKNVLNELELSDRMTIIAIAKGPSRKAGEETLFLTHSKNSLILPSDNIALHLLQHIRDEAHRFAITGHRKKRAKARQGSFLEGILGVGPQRRRQLLTQFGGLQGLKKASLRDLMQLPGIHATLAQRINMALKKQS